MVAKKNLKPEEAELNRKEEFLRRLQEELLDKELRLSTLSAELNVFEQKYLKTVSPQMAKLDELRAKLAEIINEFSGNNLDFKEIAKDFRDRAQRTKDVSDQMSHLQVIQPFVADDEMKDLFREVAKMVHPDFASNDKDRAYRSEIMKKVNDAYARTDGEALRKILLEWGNSPESLEGNGPGVELIRVIRKIAQVEERLKVIGEEIKHLENLDLYQLMIRAEEACYSGVDLIEEISNKLKNQCWCLLQKVIVLFYRDMVNSENTSQTDFPSEEDIHNLYVSLWTKATHQEGYDKPEWNRFESYLRSVGLIK